MVWMEETAARRAHPRKLWPGARSAVVLAMNYGPDANPLANLDALDNPVAVVVRGKLLDREALDAMLSEAGAQVRAE